VVDAIDDGCVGVVGRRRDEHALRAEPLAEALVERLGLLVAAGVVVERGQVVEARSDVRVLTLFVPGILAFAVGLLLSIALHEIGHLVPAKLFGVKVSQYMVGFGRTVWSRHRGETEYGFKAIPLGGYVRMVGMFPPEPGDDPRHLRRASLAVISGSKPKRSLVRTRLFRSGARTIL
jgi:hypothetical protein